MVEGTCKLLGSRNSSGIVAEDSRCSAGIGCCADGTGRMPEKCAAVSLVYQVLLLLMLELLTMLTLRPRRCEPQKPLRFARACFATTN